MDGEHLRVSGMLVYSQDTLAERLRRRPAKPMGSPRVGSNPTGVEIQLTGQGEGERYRERERGITECRPVPEGYLTG